MINTIILAYKTLEQINQTGINGILATSSDAVPLLPALILFALFIILSFGAYFSTVRRIGYASMPSVFAVAGFVTTVIAFMMSIIPNFINTLTIGFCVIIEIGFVFWLYLSKD